MCRDEAGLTSPILPQVGEGPLEIESQFRRILPTPVGRDDVALTSPYFHSPVSVSVSSSASVCNFQFRRVPVSVSGSTTKTSRFPIPVSNFQISVFQFQNFNL